MVLESTKIIGFLCILKIKHNSSLLMVLIQTLKELIVVSPKGQYFFHCYSLYTSMMPIILFNFFKVHHFADGTILINFDSFIMIANKRLINI